MVDAAGVLDIPGTLGSSPPFCAIVDSLGLSLTCLTAPLANNHSRVCVSAGWQPKVHL